MASKLGSTVQQFEARFGERVIAARWRIIAVSLVLVAAAASGSMFLTVSTDFRMFFSEDNPQLQAFDALENVYGRGENILFVVVPEDRDFASKKALEAVVWLTEQAWRVPYSLRADSLANFQHTTADGDDLFVRDLINPLKLEDAEERAWVRRTALGEPRLVNNLVAADGEVTAVNVTVEIPEEEGTLRTAEIAAFAQELAAEVEERFPGVDVRLVGTVILGSSFADAVGDSQRIFWPASLLIMVLVLGVLTRRLAGVVATGIVVVFSVLAAVGMGSWIGLPFSPPTAQTPTMVLMITVASCVHLLVTMQHRMRLGDPKDAAIIESLRINLRPVFLASATTAFGFLTMNLSEVPPYRHLGTFVAFGVIASFFLSVTFLPAMLSLLPMRPPARGKENHPVFSAVANFVIRRRTPLLWGSLLTVLVLAAAVPRNELNDILAHFFDDSVEMRRNTDFVDEHLSGNTVLEYSLVSTRPGGITEPAYLADVSAFADWYRTQPETRYVAAVSDIFRQLNKSMHGDDPAAYRLPESRELAAQYLLLYELSLPFGLDLNNQIDIGRTATRMSVTTRTLATKDVLALNERAKAWLEANASHIVQTEGSGASIMFAHLGLRNIRSMLVATLIAMVGISIVLILALRSLRLGLVSLVPNFIPAVMAFGIWGLAVGEIGLALSIVMAMTIGIVVDDTVHFLSKYVRAREELGAAPDDAVRYALQTAGRSMFTTTVVLVFGFLVFLLSPFVPTADVGLFAALIITLAIVADFLLLPPLLMLGDRNAGTAETSPEAA